MGGGRSRASRQLLPALPYLPPSMAVACASRHSGILPIAKRNPSPTRMHPTLPERTLHCLLLADPDAKITALESLHADWQAGTVPLPDSIESAQTIVAPGRPEKPPLVPPQNVPRRSVGTPEGHAALIHALAHIEFNAINLALDAVCRFAGMPGDYYFVRCPSHASLAAAPAAAGSVFRSGPGHREAAPRFSMGRHLLWFIRAGRHLVGAHRGRAAGFFLPDRARGLRQSAGPTPSRDASDRMAHRHRGRDRGRLTPN